MMRKLRLLSAVLVLSSAHLYAEDYQIEANGILGFTNEEQGNNKNDSDAISLLGTYYLAPVKVTAGPLAEAAFIQHASSVTAFILSRDYDSNQTADWDSQGAAAQLVGASGLFLNLLIYQSEQGTTDVDGFGFGAGYYLTALSTLEGNYEWLDVDNTDVNLYSLDYRQLTLQNSPYKMAIELNGELRSSDFNNDDHMAYGGTLILYPNDLLGLSLGLNHVDADSYDQNSMTLSADYFLQTNLHVGASYTFGSVDPDNNANDIDQSTLAFNAGIRF
jgi:hypothetical protein